MSSQVDAWFQELDTDGHVGDLELFLRKVCRALVAAKENVAILAARGWPGDSRDHVRAELEHVEATLAAIREYVDK